MGPNVYVWAGLPETLELRLDAARKRLPPEAVFSGLTAAWLHGLDVGAGESIEVTIPKGIGVSARSGIEVRRAALSPKDVVSIRGKRVTSTLRTLSDICLRLSVTEAAVVTDMALHTRLVSLDDLNALCVRRARCFGVARLRCVVGFAEPASESQMESRLRMLLVLSGLPRPQAQVKLHDEKGLFLGRPDRYYPSHRLALEYDGATHRTSLVEDNRRQNRLVAAGIRLLRFTAGDVLHNPDSVVTQVRGYLASRAVLPGVPARAGLGRVGLSAGPGIPGEMRP